MDRIYTCLAQFQPLLLINTIFPVSNLRAVITFQILRQFFSEIRNCLFTNTIYKLLLLVMKGRLHQ